MTLGMRSPVGPGMTGMADIMGYNWLNVKCVFYILFPPYTPRSHFAIFLTEVSCFPVKIHILDHTSVTFLPKIARGP